MSLQSLQETARKHPDGDQRCKALHELVSGWKNKPEVLRTLRECADNDEYWKARATSLQNLAEVDGHNASTRKLIVEHAKKDPDSRVRSTAVEIVPSIRPARAARTVLSGWARVSKYADVRQAALSAICERFGNNKTVLALLLDRAKNDSEPLVRVVAVEALIRDWRDNPKVFSFLCERAKKDDDPDVKRAANGVTVPKIQVFVSYSHKDARYMKLILEYVSHELRRDGIELWWDERIVTGSLWDNEIKAKIRESHIALALVSQSFLNSDYCQKVEIRSFMQKRKSEGMVIFPIILSACMWDYYEWLSTTQFLPPGDKNLKSHYQAPGKREELFLRILVQLRQVAREIQSNLKR
jgi:hypothetical protein